MRDPRVAEAFELVKEMRPMLKGRDPAVLGATLASMLAHFIAGHDETLRAQVMKMHIERTWAMVHAILKEQNDA